VGPINANWNRWIVSAITEHFDDLARPGLFIQHVGFADETDSHDTWIRIRYAGPTYQNLNPPTMYRGSIQVSILIQAEDKGNDVYFMERLSGEVAAKFTCINVYDDDDVYVGTLNLVPWTRSEQVKVVNYGVLQDMNHARCLVIGDYIIDLGG
jgi:sulfur relay (sulfurtransferase) DsrF/TusC family protein